jgi:hypothetical protein
MSNANKNATGTTGTARVRGRAPRQRGAYWLGLEAMEERQMASAVPLPAAGPSVEPQLDTAPIIVEHQPDATVTTTASTSTDREGAGAVVSAQRQAREAGLRGQLPTAPMQRTANGADVASLGSVNGRSRFQYRGDVGNGANGVDAYNFSVASPSANVRFKLKGLDADADLRLVDANNQVVAQSVNGGRSNELIRARLGRGNYSLQVVQYDGATNYQVSGTMRGQRRVGRNTYQPANPQPQTPAQPQPPQPNNPPAPQTPAANPYAQLLAQSAWQTNGNLFYDYRYEFFQNGDAAGRKVQYYNGVMVNQAYIYSWSVQGNVLTVNYWTPELQPAEQFYLNAVSVNQIQATPVRGGGTLDLYRASF